MKSSSAIRLAALAVVLSSSAALAEWRTYQGGNWNNASSWSPAGIPNEFDLAIFQSAHAGNVYVGGGFDVYEIQIEGGSDGYHFTAETNAIGNVQRITNHGANTIIQIPNLRGLPFQNGYAIAVQSPVDMEIRSSLSDTDGQSLDAYISRTWTRPNFHSGMTYLIGSTFLEDQGNFQASPLIVFDKAPMFVNNMDFETERFNDAAQLQMTAGFLHMDGPVNERVGGVHILQGDTRIALSNGAGMVGAGPGLTRDNTKRGTLMLESDWEAFKVAPNVFGTEIVPYVTHYGNLAQYNPGEDLIPGNTDDVGFLPILGTDLDLALTDEHASVGDDTMFEAQTVRSLQVLSNTTFATGDQQLTLTDGVMVMGDGARITQSIAGTVVLQGPEGIVHVPYGTATVSARLNAVTLTKGGSGILVLDGPNNISGPYVINGGRLHLDSINSINASNELRLVEASLELNMPSTTLPNHIVFDLGTLTPFTNGGYTSEIKLKENSNYTFSGLLEGRGAYNLFGNNSTLIVSGVHSSTGTVEPNEGFSFWPLANTRLDITGRLGDANNRANVIMFNGRLTGNGEVSGGIQLTGGTFAPGTNNGTDIALFESYDFSIGDTGKLELTIGGTTRGATYDALDVERTAYFFGGQIVISGGYTGQIGDQYDLVRYGESFFDVGVEIVNPLNTESGGQWVAWRDSNSFTLAVAGPTGDSNLDGTVDFLDLLLVAQHYNEMGQDWQTGDFNNDTLVNFHDLLLIAQNYGESAFSADSLGLDFETDWRIALAHVPEPTSLMLVGGVGLLVTRRRRR